MWQKPQIDLMNLKQKILKLLDVYYPEDTTAEEIQKDLAVRGKIDERKIIEILFMIIDEIDNMPQPKVKIKK